MDERLRNDDTGRMYDVRIFMLYSSVGRKMFHKRHCLFIAVGGVMSRVEVDGNAI